MSNYHNIAVIKRHNKISRCKLSDLIEKCMLCKMVKVGKNVSGERRLKASHSTMNIFYGSKFFDLKMRCSDFCDP